MSRMTMVQVGVVFFAVCLLTQVRESFYQSLNLLINKFKININEIVDCYNYFNMLCVYLI